MTSGTKKHWMSSLSYSLLVVNAITTAAKIHEHAMSVHIPRLCYQSMLLVNAIINNDCYPRSVLALISNVSTDGDTNSNFEGSFYRVCALL